MSGRISGLNAELDPAADVGDHRLPEQRPWKVGVLVEEGHDPRPSLGLGFGPVVRD